MEIEAVSAESLVSLTAPEETLSGVVSEVVTTVSEVVSTIVGNDGGLKLCGEVVDLTLPQGDFGSVVSMLPDKLTVGVRCPPNHSRRSASRHTFLPPFTLVNPGHQSSLFSLSLQRKRVASTAMQRQHPRRPSPPSFRPICLAWYVAFMKLANCGLMLWQTSR